MIRVVFVTKITIITMMLIIMMMMMMIMLMMMMSRSSNNINNTGLCFEYYQGAATNSIWNVWINGRTPLSARRKLPVVHSAKQSFDARASESDTVDGWVDGCINS
mmetsp:Transcript_45638/g.110554  ORF Transcript_45638/g.110554 Transcript_45638/m.110554 type:complete len:105 (-) Transcript_45638:1116-1430(-)